MKQSITARIQIGTALAALIISMLACAGLPGITPTAYVTVGPDPAVTVSPDEMKSAGEVIRKRLEAASLYHGMEVGDTQIKIYLASVDDKPTVTSLATQTGVLAFYVSDGIAYEAGSDAPDGLRPVLTDENIISAQASPSPTMDAWQITVKFNPDGSDVLANITGSRVGAFMVVAQDGVVLTSPEIMAAITGGEAVIAGNFDESSARLIAAELTGGRLPLELILVDAGLVTPKP